MACASQLIYEKAVRQSLPSAFVTSLERIDEFVIGVVLVRRHKQRRYYSNSLDFTSAPLQLLLSRSEQESFSFQTTRKTLLTGESTSKEKFIVINPSLDVDVSNILIVKYVIFLMKVNAAIVSVGGKIGGHIKDSCIISVDFGDITHTLSNMYEALSTRQYTVDLKHPVVQDAIKKGKKIFIITSVYTARKVEIKVC